VTESGARAGRRTSREPKHPKSCHERALGLLAVRPRTRQELERRLLQAKFPAEEVQDVLERLERVDLIDDRAFAEQFAQHQFSVKHAGRRGVMQALLAKGVDRDLAAMVTEQGPGDEDDRAERLATARATRMVGVDPAKAHARLTGILMRRGHSPETARRAARRALDLGDAQE
jgi:regulatory protein